jgi:hypothetical protein
MLNLAFFMMLQALNTTSFAKYDLNGPIGQVYAMATINDITLFARGQSNHYVNICFLQILNQI